MIKFDVNEYSGHVFDGVMYESCVTVATFDTLDEAKKYAKEKEKSWTDPHGFGGTLVVTERDDTNYFDRTDLL